MNAHPTRAKLGACEGSSVLGAFHKDFKNLLPLFIEFMCVNIMQTWETSLLSWGLFCQPPAHVVDNSSHQRTVRSSSHLQLWSRQSQSIGFFCCQTLSQRPPHCGQKKFSLNCRSTQEVLSEPTWFSISPWAPPLSWQSPRAGCLRGWPHYSLHDLIRCVVRALRWVFICGAPRGDPPWYKVTCKRQSATYCDVEA